MYQRMFIASVTVDTPAGEQTFIGVSHFEGGASGHLGENLEAHGFTSNQIGRILERARVSEMSRKSMGCTLTLPGRLTHGPWAKKTHW
jgi:hypothetical protein